MVHTNTTFKQILKKIEEFDTIIIHGHVRPDGDCVGSQFGLKNLILDNYPTKHVYVDGDTCDYCSFLGNPIKVDDETYHNSLCIVVDCGNEERISDQRYKNGSFLIKIDHHIPDNQYGDLYYVEEDAASCTQIIVDFARKTKLTLTKNAAYPLYVGLVTDSGRFRFDSVTPHTFENAAILLSTGIDIADVDNKLSVTTLDTLKLNGYTLNNMKWTENGFIYIIMTQEVVKQYGVTNEVAANQVSNLAGIEGFPVWGLVMEYPDEIRIRLRSRGPEVKTLANKYQGGGHEKAAGAHLDSWDELDSFLKDCDNLVKEYKENNK